MPAGNPDAGFRRRTIVRHRWLVAVTAAVMAVGACAEPSGGAGPTASVPGGEPGTTTPPTTEPAALDGAWVLTAGTVDGSEIPLDPGYRVTMTIDGATVGGRSACNSYGGDLAVDDGSISIGRLGGTDMACEPPIMEIEAAFLDGLVRVTEAARDGHTLVLTGSEAEFTFSLLPPVATADLVGVTWVLDTIIQGDTATTADPATLRLDPDGTLTGSTGCRDLSGEYMVTGDTVLFTSFAADGECPEDGWRQDGFVVTVLGDGFTVQIDGDRLTVMGTGGEGLSYRASGS